MKSTPKQQSRSGVSKELQEVAKAAHTLCSFKYKKLDTATASVVQNTGVSKEPKEVANAAHTLCSFKYKKLDAATASVVQETITHVLNLQPGKSQHREGPPAEEAEASPPPLLETPPVPNLAGVIGQCSVPFEKQLTKSDVSDEQSRLAMNKRNVERCIFPLLDAEERQSLAGREGIEVTTYDWRGKEYPMRFKVWVEKTPVLMGGWKKFYQEVGLKSSEDWVCVWVFRHLTTGKLCFVITSRRVPLSLPAANKADQEGDQGGHSIGILKEAPG